LEGKWETVKEPPKVSSNVMGRLTLVDFNKKKGIICYGLLKKRKKQKLY